MTLYFHRKEKEKITHRYQKLHLIDRQVEEKTKKCYSATHTAAHMHFLEQLHSIDLSTRCKKK